MPAVKRGYRLVPEFLAAAEIAALREGLDARAGEFVEVSSKRGLNRPYGVLDGGRAGEALAAIGARVCAAIEAIVGEGLQPIHDARRALRVQRYRGREQGFRWHLDGGRYSGLLTLQNDNGGVTEVIPPRGLAGALVRGPDRIHAGAGDLLVLHGRRVLHRGVIERDEGERLVIVATFDRAGTRPSPRFDRFAQWLNYT